MESNNKITLGSLFDGIGGFPYAASFYGITPRWASEVLPSAISITKRHFPDMEHLGDITAIDGKALEPVDIISFGSPCQGLSQAGLRLGLADERSGLFTHAIRIIREMQEVTHGKYPRFAIFENVPGALTSTNGADFRAVLEAFTEAEIPMPKSGKWTGAGMVRSHSVDLAWVFYDAQNFGTAQRRKRLFLVADFRGQRAVEILFVPKSLQGYFAKGGTPWQGATAYSQRCAHCSITILNDQGGQQMSVEAEGKAPTLRSQTHGNLPIVAECKHCAQIHPEKSGTLCASGAGLSRPAGMASEMDLCVAYCLQGSMIGRADKNGPKGDGINTDICFTLNTTDRHCVAFSQQRSDHYREDNVASTQTARQYKDATDLVVSAVDCRNLKEIGDLSGTLQSKSTPGYSLNYQNPVRTGQTVRRLTPTECERLQGYPDGWTAYGHDGKLISDSQRYQMLGNSIAVPCVAYIMQGIVDALQEEL